MTRVGWLIREPLLWFALIGALLFWLDDRYNNAERAILIDEARINRLASLWQTQMRRPPTDSELESLIGNWVEEETFYREALRLNLDDADTIVRRRLLQKYQFLLEEVAESELGDAAVAAHYRANLSDYMNPERASYEHILLGDFKATDASARGALAGGADWRALGTSSLLAPRYELQSTKDMLFTMGPGFPSQLDLTQVGVWQGPIRSSYGNHLVRIVRVEPAAPKPLASIVKKVRYDLADTISEQRKAEALERLRRRYPVIDARR